MEPAAAYGAAKAGKVVFDPVAFFTHPRTIMRLLSWVFSMVVFSCIVNEGYVNIGSERLLCVFNKNADACNFGVTVGVACFLASAFFLLLDAVFPSFSSLADRRRAVLLDLVCSGMASFLWFVGFCFLANQWQATSPDELPLSQGADAARAAIAFCFFSIITWVGGKQAISKILLFFFFFFFYICVSSLVINRTFCCFKHCTHKSNINYMIF
uniref:Synaptogyrin 3b n=1 Tax=Hippocampus comes TaxID=109280 RepID=A0A3Q2YQI4_HIPCM